MPRLLGVDIPNDRPTFISLTYLYGVGVKTARELCHKAGVNPHMRARELKEDELGRLAALLDKDYVVEGHLRRQVSSTAAAGHGCVDCARRPAGRGQRTRTNAGRAKGQKDGCRKEGRQGPALGIGPIRDPVAAGRGRG